MSSRVILQSFTCLPSLWWSTTHNGFLEYIVINFILNLNILQCLSWNHIWLIVVFGVINCFSSGFKRPLFSGNVGLLWFPCTAHFYPSVEFCRVFLWIFWDLTMWGPCIIYFYPRFFISLVTCSSVCCFPLFWTLGFHTVLWVSFAFFCISIFLPYLEGILQILPTLLFSFNFSLHSCNS